jgi:hypothetical protein
MCIGDVFPIICMFFRCDHKDYPIFYTFASATRVASHALRTFLNPISDRSFSFILIFVQLCYEFSFHQQWGCPACGLSSLIIKLYIDVAHLQDIKYSKQH